MTTHTVRGRLGGGIALLLVVLSIAAAGRLLLVVTRRPPTDEVVTEQVAFLEEAIDDGADDRMQELFPEGRFFMHALTGLAAVAPTGGPVSSEDVAAARRHLRVLEDEGTRFGSGMSPDQGIFHVGWTLQLAVDVADASGSDGDMDVVRRWAAVVVTGLEQHGPFPQSYPGRRWPVDSVVAASALARAADLLVEEPWADTVTAWRRDAMEHADSELGLLPHEVDGTNVAIDGPRGSSQSMIQAFWPDVAEDEEMASRQWGAFTDAFLVRRLGVLGIREYLEGTSGTGDIDSGPLVVGLSAVRAPSRWLRPDESGIERWPVTWNARPSCSGSG